MIYLASPYTHDDPSVRDERYEATCRAAAELIQAGHTVYSGIGFGHALIRFGLPTDWEFWKRQDAEQIEHADEVIVLTLDGWETSVGVNAELEFAKRLGKPVRYVGKNATFATCGDGRDGVGGGGYWESLTFEPNGKFERLILYREGSDRFTGTYYITANSQVHFAIEERNQKLPKRLRRNGPDPMRKLSVQENARASAHTLCAIDSQGNLLIINPDFANLPSDNDECCIPTRHYQRGSWDLK